MKKIFVIALLLSAYFSNAQSSLLSADFWKNNPNLKTVKKEIKQGNSASEANRGNYDPVSMAINNNASLDVIKFLIDQEGNSVDKTTHDGRLYIHWAANKGNIDLIKYLIEKGTDINRTDDKGATPLAFAASNGQIDKGVYEAFFKAGVSPKYRNANGATFMHLAVGYDKELALTDFLISKGLNLDDVDANGNTVFDYAARTGIVPILTQLEIKGIKPTDRALIFASEGTRFSANSLDFYKYLVEELNLNPSVQGSNGENVLHNLVKKKEQEEIVAYFLSQGVDVNQTNKEGNTVLMEAAKGSDVSVLKNINDKTTNINQLNNNGMSALSFAVNNGSAEVVTTLIAEKADLNVRDNAGNLISYYLVQSYGPVRPNQKDQFPDKLEVLKNAGVDFKAPQKDGSTLLHLAVAKNDVKLFKQFEQFGLNVNEVNEEQMTALHKAALIAKDDQVLKYLVAQGADVTLKTEFDETAYDLASENEILQKANISIDFLK